MITKPQRKRVTREKDNEIKERVGGEAYQKKYEGEAEYQSKEKKRVIKEREGGKVYIPEIRKKK